MDKNLAIAVAADAIADVADFQETGAASFQDPDSATSANAEFCHATNPGWRAANVGNVSPFVGLEQVQGKEFASHENRHS